MKLPEPGTSTELLCLHGGWDFIRAKFQPGGPKVIVRTRLSTTLPVEGELFVIEVEKSWIFGKTAYISGEITSTRFDLDALELAPLRLEAFGPRPFEEEWIEDLPDHIAAEIRAGDPWDVFEMEQVLPEDAVKLRHEDDPIVEAGAFYSAGYIEEAYKILGKLLSVDLRCLDGHSHLGNFEFRSTMPDSPERAARHYAVGVAIGDLTLGRDFRGMLPWGLLDNRPFLRCLHGLALCHWRLGTPLTAQTLLHRLLLLNPSDNQGARFLWAQIEAGQQWSLLE